MARKYVYHAMDDDAVEEVYKEHYEDKVKRIYEGDPYRSVGDAQTEINNAAQGEFSARGRPEGAAGIATLVRRDRFDDLIKRTRAEYWEGEWLKVWKDKGWSESEGRLAFRQMFDEATLREVNQKHMKEVINLQEKWTWRGQEVGRRRERDEKGFWKWVPIRTFEGEQPDWAKIVAEGKVEDFRKGNIWAAKYFTTVRVKKLESE